MYFVPTPSPSCWGRGDGTFQAAPDVGWERVLSPSPWATSMAMAARIWPPPIVGAHSVSILLGRGDGTFQAAPDVAVGRYPVVHHGGRLQWRWPPGSGHRQCRLPTPCRPAGAGRWHLPGRPDVGGGSGPAVRHRGRLQWRWPPDLATANGLGASTVSILLGRGDGTFQAAPDIGWETSPVSITVGDFNGDGRPDLATANVVCQHRVDPAGAGRWHLPGRPGRGGGSRLLRPSRWGTSMAMAAWISPPPIRRCRHRVDPAGPGRWHLSGRPELGVGALPVSITVGDFNGDGRPDLATANAVANTVSILLGRGDGTFQAAPDVWRWEVFLVHHGGRLQWRWPPGSRHGQ